MALSSKKFNISVTSVTNERGLIAFDYAVLYDFIHLQNYTIFSSSFFKDTTKLLIFVSLYTTVNKTYCFRQNLAALLACASGHIFGPFSTGKIKKALKHL